MVLILSFVGGMDLGSDCNQQLTIASNCGALEELETIAALESGDLAVGELGQELGLLVVLEVDVVPGEVGFKTCERGDRADLGLQCLTTIRTLAVLRTYTLALSLFGDGVERTERHF